MRTFAALAASGLAFAAAGCGGGDTEAETGERRLPPELVGSTAVEGGTAGERQLLRRVVDGMKQTALRRIEITRARTAGNEAVSIEFAPVGGETARRQWEEWIVAGALSRRLLAADSPAVVESASKGAGFRARPRVRGNPDPRPLSGDRQKAILTAIRRAVKRSGADLVSLEAHRPYGVAIAVSLSTDDPARFLANQLRAVLTSLGAHRSHVEGVYLAVLEDRREIVLEWGSWTRNPAGTFWVRADLADCSPIRQSPPPGSKPPPRCPAR